VEITEVRIKLMEEGGERLQAFCSITFDNCFVIRDLKIIEGANGPFVAMPSRKLTSHCPQCGAKNHLRAGFCNDCGHKLNANRAPLDDEGRAKLYADIAHPINSACREMIQERVIREFHQEQERAKQPGYVSRYDDFDVDDFVPPRQSRSSARSHPTTNYTRHGGDRASHHAQVAERPVRPQPKPTMTQPVPLSQPPSFSAVQSHIAEDGHAVDGNAVDGHVADEAPASPKTKSDDFGAGIL
jgi:stage V sporulation protein G